MKKIFSSLVLLCTLTFGANSANALISIDITRGNADPMPVALPYLAGDSEEAAQIAKQVIDVVQKDLEGSGLFRSINRDSFLQDIASGQTLPTFPSWRQVNASALITGGLKVTGENSFSAEFRLWDVFAEQQIAGKSYNTNKKNWRRIAHLISDEIYKRLTGEEGYFDTRVVYVSESGSPIKRIKKLAIMDQDGENHRYLTDGSSLVLTPRFSPTAQKVIYMSYRGDTPKVYSLDVDTREQELVGDFPGMSFSPRFSNNGDSVIMSAALDGNSEIYSMNIKTKQKKRLTNDKAIDTSPSFSPDGSHIVFNSDRGGSQQLYIMDANGDGVKRISFGNGRYGTPVWSPRGDLIAFTKIIGGQFYIGIMRTDGTGERLLTQSFMDEGPTWSPNGRVIMFARQERSSRDRAGKWKIFSVDLTGYNEKLVPTPMEGSDPAWSPLISNNGD